MWSLLYFLPTVGLCYRIPVNPKSMTVLLNKTATLPCDYKRGDVSWIRYIGGQEVILATIKNGEEKIPDKDFGSLADNSLVIRKVTSSDSGMYFCNETSIYLDVTTDPNKVNPKARNVPDPPRKDGQGFGFSSDRNEVATGGDEDAKNKQASDFWKIPVGVVLGAAFVLLGFIVLRFCSKKRGETNPDVAKTGTERIYEEIEAAEEQLRSQSDVESPYSWTSISEIQSTSTSLYSYVSKLNTKVHSDGECVYYLAQNPPQTGSVG